MKQEIKPTQLKDWIENQKPIHIVDVRSPLEFGTGHVPGAVNIPLGSIAGELPGIAQQDTVVVICHSGMRSGSACDRLSARYDHMFSIVGGTSAWIAAGFEVERSPKSPRSLDRQVHFVAGLLIATSLFLSARFDLEWRYLALLPTFGLLLDAFTGFCPMTVVLRNLPWNQSSQAAEN